MFVGSALAHDAGSLAGTPVCLESNLMAADAMNAPRHYSRQAVHQFLLFISCGGRSIELSLHNAHDHRVAMTR